MEVKQQPNLNRSQKKLLSLCFDCSCDENVKDVVQLLKQKTIDPNFRTKGKRETSPLIEAIRSGNLSLVEVLVEAGADVNSPVRHIRIPVTFQDKTVTYCVYKYSIYVAVCHDFNDISILEFLISQGALVNVRTNINIKQSASDLITIEMPIIAAAYKFTHLQFNINFYKAIRSLMSHGANLANKGVNPLLGTDVMFVAEKSLISFAFMHDDLKFLHEMLDAGCPVCELPGAMCTEKLFIKETNDSIDRNTAKLNNFDLTFAYKRLFFLGFKFPNNCSLLKRIGVDQHSTMSLKQICRVNIRHLLHDVNDNENISTKIHCLEIPSLLKDWLHGKKHWLW